MDNFSSGQMPQGSSQQPSYQQYPYGQPGQQPNLGGIVPSTPIMETASATTSPDNSSGNAVYVVAIAVLIAMIALANSLGGLIEQAVYEAAQGELYGYTQPLDPYGSDSTIDYPLGNSPRSYDL